MPSKPRLSEKEIRAQKAKSKNAKNWRQKDYFFMQKALALSTKGRPSPNPYVGALIVKNGKIISEGYHSKAGMLHAEAEAIKSAYSIYGKKASSLLKGSTLYVTLEPCSHHGRQPPCTDAIMREKFGSVIFAMKDPNPNVSGGGEKILRKAGISARGGLLAEEAASINAAFISTCVQSRPLLTLKLALSSDGKPCGKNGRQVKITSAMADELVHQMRSNAGAIMVGAGTIMADNPHLTARIKGGHDPLRVILDPILKTSPNAHVYSDKNVIVAISKHAPASRTKLFASKGISLLSCPSKGVSANAQIDVKFALRSLYSRGINHVFCEGGPTLAASLLCAGIADELLVFVSQKPIREQIPPKIGERVRTIQSFLACGIAGARKVGDDWLFVAKLGRLAKGCLDKPYGPLQIGD